MDGLALWVFAVGVLAIVWYITGGKDDINQWEENNVENDNPD